MMTTEKTFSFPGCAYARVTLAQPLAIAIRRKADSPCLAQEPLTPADLAPLVSETWLELCLRQGYPNLPLAEMEVGVFPERKANGVRFLGLELECALPGGQPQRRSFSLKCLAPVARRVASRLITSGVLASGQTYVYELVVNTAPALPRAGDLSGIPEGTIKMMSPPLKHLQVPFRELLEQAEPVDLIDDDAFPVFLTADCLARAEQCSRRGMKAKPPVETGGVLIGTLASCPVSKEFFAVVTDVIEVCAAEQTTFSLSYTSDTWTRLQAMLAARQAAYSQRPERFLGQCHGHNFRPHDETGCDTCEHQKTCQITSVFISQDDQAWMGAVFARQPWSLCFIFGLGARNNFVSKLYSLRDGQWLPRGYYVLPDFKMESWPLAPSK